ncbi:MAG TPA: acetate/propionate family kinase [Acidimicrobiales bacterium]|nr:acetate/propionate family kinase [Acidimicrobiales bacterium]
MRVLVVNAGSSSVKASVLDADDTLLVQRDRAVDPEGSFPGLLDAVLDEIFAAVPVLDAAGHRVVHGGADHRTPLVLEGGAEAALAGLAELAPLHNPPALAAIARLRTRRPDLVQVACFDTAFHATLPAAAATFAVPAEWRALGVRRFGFHGLSHAWASRRAAELLGRPVASLRLVTAHLGAGASLAAVEGGRSVDTTMGFTPLDGLVMATRSGTVDPGAVLWLQRRLGLGPAEVEDALTRRSGLLGLTGTTGDLRRVLADAAGGDPDAGLAVDVYLHRLRGAVAAMAAATGGTDALVFTGGAGEHSAWLRQATCDGLGFLGLELDPVRNEGAGGDGPDAVVSPPHAGAAVVVVHAREDLEIARQVRTALGAP